MRRLFAFAFGLLIVLCLSIPPAQAQSPSWRGFILLEFTESFGEIDLPKQVNLTEALSGLCPTSGDYPPYLLQIMVRNDKTAIIAECRWYAKPQWAEIIRVIAFKFDASLVQAEAWISTLTYFGEDQAYSVSLSEMRAYLEGKDEWKPPRRPVP